MEPDTPSLQSTRLFDQVRKWIRCQDYIFRIKTIAIFICFCRYSATQTGGKRYEREMGG